jgi:hypothetical protein
MTSRENTIETSLFLVRHLYKTAWGISLHFCSIYQSSNCNVAGLRCLRTPLALAIHSAARPGTFSLSQGQLVLFSSLAFVCCVLRPCPLFVPPRVGSRQRPGVLVVRAPVRAITLTAPTGAGLVTHTADALLVISLRALHASGSHPARPVKVGMRARGAITQRVSQIISRTPGRK